MRIILVTSWLHRCAPSLCTSLYGTLYHRLLILVIWDIMIVGMMERFKMAGNMAPTLDRDY